MEDFMMRITKMISVSLLMVGVLCMFTSPAVAGPDYPRMSYSRMSYSKLSSHHTLYGVSQFLASRSTGYGAYIKIVNPTPVTMIVAILVYDAGSGGSGAGPREYTDYRVFRLEPHEAASYDGEDYDFAGKYLEIIAAPEKKVRVGNFYSRKADGLGISGTMGSYGGGHLWLLYPNLFTLPEDAPFPGQRQAAIDDVIGGLNAIGAPDSTFTEFGIKPWDATP
jgi:hypothetical protein